ncbi:MAG TPA: CidA/LrgA family protein [Bacillota bacterium]|nr:CidA/LrgA family protein [Bacillota bacterium]
MDVIRMMLHIFILYIFYWIGTWVQTTFHLFIPGSVMGMVLFFILLLSKVFNPKWIEQGASLLIRHLPLLFLPATVGAIAYLELFSGRGLWLVGIVLFSTLLVMYSSGAMSQQLVKKREKRYE